MGGTWRQPTPLNGLSRFLVEHEPCGAGFDVSHPAGLGSGRISMTCRGCGTQYEYATATIEFEREVEFEPLAIRASPDLAPSLAPSPAPSPGPPLPEVLPVPEPPASGEPPPALHPELPPPGDRGSGRGARIPAWARDRIVNVALLVFALAAIAFAIVRIAGDGGGTSRSPTQRPAPARTRGAAAIGLGSPNASPTLPREPGPVLPRAPALPLDLRLFRTERFSVVIPASWKAEPAAGGGTRLAPPASPAVSLTVYLEYAPSLSAREMSVQTAAFLRSRYPGVAVSEPHRERIAGRGGFRLSARDAGTSIMALGVIAAPYRYLVLTHSSPRARPAEEAALRRALASFRPR